MFRFLLIISLALLAQWPVGLVAQTQELPLLGSWRTEVDLPVTGYGSRYNEIWGMALDGREYAIIGSTIGTHIIDVTEPASADEVAFVPGGSQGSHLVHRDYHNYGCYLYAVADEGSASTLQIIDMSSLPAAVTVVYDAATLLNRAHNIFIDTSQARLYTFATRGGSTANSALRIYDLADDPLNPQFLAEHRTFGGLTVGHVHDGFVRDHLAYLNCGYSGLAIVDFTDPLKPVTLGTLTDYPTSGYNHSGWPTVDDDYYYFSDENHTSPVKVFDTRTFEVADTVAVPNGDASSIAHNQIVACDYLYVSYYYDGLQVFDISDPANPVPSHHFSSSTWPRVESYHGAWGVYPFLPSGRILVSDMQNGLFVLAGPQSGSCYTQAVTALTDCELPNDLVGTEAPANEELIELYPQPADDRFWVTAPGAQRIEIRDIQGRILQTWSVSGPGPWDFARPAGLPAGAYLLRIVTERGGYSRFLLFR
jgi:choice-of-anchor B domain-containing protein